MSGDLITCLTVQNNKTCDEPPPATRPRITEQPSVEKSETPSVAITPESASLHHNQVREAHRLVFTIPYVWCYDLQK